MKLIPKVNKEIYREVARELDVGEDMVIEAINYMWKGTANFIQESPVNVIQLRFLGTFCGKKEIVGYMEQHKKKKHEKPS